MQDHCPSVIIGCMRGRNEQIEQIQKQNSVKDTEVSSEFLDSLVQELVAAVAPEKIILFGSRAREEAEPDSDIDLLLQVETGANIRDVTKETYRTIRRLDRRPMVDIDIVVKDRAYVERYGDLVGTIVRPALKEGKVIYAQ